MVLAGFTGSSPNLLKIIRFPCSIQKDSIPLPTIFKQNES